MRTILLLPFIFLLSCTAPGPEMPALTQSGYLITDYASNGKVENTYFVKDYVVGGDDVSFSVDNKTKTIIGSFKIEKITKN
jgi:hypothetical protein